MVHVIDVLPEGGNSGIDWGRATRGAVVSFIRNFEIVSNLSQLSPLSVREQRHSLHGPGPTNPAISRVTWLFNSASLSPPSRVLDVLHARSRLLVHLDLALSNARHVSGSGLAQVESFVTSMTSVVFPLDCGEANAIIKSCLRVCRQITRDCIEGTNAGPKKEERKDGSWRRRKLSASRKSRFSLVQRRFEPLAARRSLEDLVSAP